MTDSEKTVLLVDDDDDILMQYCAILEADGFNVVTAESREEAERQLETIHPDLAIVDLMMEEMDGGFTLCYHIKKKDASIPVLISSSVTSETGLDFEGLSADERSWIKADGFLAKPIRPEQLRQEVARLLRT